MIPDGTEIMLPNSSGVEHSGDFDV